jgi:hypothetical protein
MMSCADEARILTLRQSFSAVITTEGALFLILYGMSHLPEWEAKP